MRAPDGHTCGANCYDNFVVDARLNTVVHGVARLADAGTNPHVPVRLLIKASECRGKVRRLVKPPHVPGRLPHGPLNDDASTRVNSQAEPPHGQRGDDHQYGDINQAAGH